MARNLVLLPGMHGTADLFLDFMKALPPDVCSRSPILRIKPGIQVAEIEGPHLILQREPQKAAAIVTHFINQRA